MKRITSLLLALAMLICFAGAAQADGIDLKVKGTWDFAFGIQDNGTFSDNVNRKSSRDDDNTIARHRIRTQINFIASESLQGVLMFEMGTYRWGEKSTGAALDADGVNVEVKRAYLDWTVPNTQISVRMGIQGIKLPSTPMGSSLLDADVAGVVASSPITDWMSVTALWLRPFDYKANDGEDRHYNDEVDIFGLLLPLSGNGWSFTPYALYAFIGANSGMYDYLYDDYNYDNSVTVENSHTKGYWLGGHFKLDLFDPLVFNVDGVYNRISKADLGGFKGLPAGSEFGVNGWFVAATLDYKLDWATPGIFGWYGSGDKANANDDGTIGRMAALGNDGGGFYPTSFGFAGSFATGIAPDGYVSCTGVGTWGIGIQLADVSFIDKLSHTLRFAYYRGTNDADLIKKGNTNINRGFLRLAHDQMYLTDEDSVFEVNFDHKYQIYENLTMAVELGWLRLNSDEDTWRDHPKADENSNAWRGMLMFKYSF